jgi:S-DNA-T family DNA segregation ATPase FtsK/SpoIIIE
LVTKPIEPLSALDLNKLMPASLTEPLEKEQAKLVESFPIGEVMSEQSTLTKKFTCPEPISLEKAALLRVDHSVDRAQGVKNLAAVEASLFLLSANRLRVNTVLSAQLVAKKIPHVLQALGVAALEDATPSYTLPPHGIIKGPAQSLKTEVTAIMLERGKLLEKKLAHFGVKGCVIAIKPGPIITLFEYQPDINTKLSKITALEDDLSMALQAMSIRIIAPIPGRNAVGFEIANQTRESVYASHLFESKLFGHTKANLPIVIGVDILGKPIIEDLVGMPHLLVGGTTGSGKSVGVNVMLTSLLLTKTPDELRLVLVDPKRLEFTPYADVPHLLFPIVTDPLKAAQVLKWVVHEMEQRYIKMAEAGVRNVLDYAAHREMKLQQGDASCDRMPFIAVVIDELADLMMVAGKEVEFYIVRLAQMARAAGIHMIVATQRPSVDVVTGIIKVNFPSRIAFRVSSKVDSRTILDQSGAEKLLGKGDLLFMHASAPTLQRVHGAYLAEKEIERVTSHARRERKVVYLSPALVDTVNRDQADQEEDELYQQVLAFIKTVDDISISSLQRQYRIGFNRSARMIDQLEQDGFLAPAQGSKPRKILH